MPLFDALCQRERAPYAVIGEATQERELVLTIHFDNKPIDMPLDILLGKAPKMLRDVKSLKQKVSISRKDIDLKDAVYRVLHLPAVAEKPS